MSSSGLKHSSIGRTVFLACTLGLAASAPGESAQGWTHVGNIDHETVNQAADGNILVDGKIDGHSHVTLQSKLGSIVIRGKIDGGSEVHLWAARNITIGTEGDAGNRKVDGASHVWAMAGGFFKLGNKIDNGEPFSQFGGVYVKAGMDIDIGDKIDGMTSNGFCTKGGKIHVHGKIDGPTHVRYWPSAALVVDHGIKNGFTAVVADKNACLLSDQYGPWSYGPPGIEQYL